MDNFINETKTYIDSGEVSTISLDTALKIKKINSLGFLTDSSQEGMNKKQPLFYVAGDKKGTPIVKNGHKATLYIMKQRAYCSGFIQDEIICKFNKILHKMIKMIIYPSNEIVPLTTEYVEYEDGSVDDDVFTTTPVVNEEDIAQIRLDLGIKGHTYICIYDENYEDSNLFDLIIDALTEKYCSIMGGLGPIRRRTHNRKRRVHRTVKHRLKSITKSNIR
jgi:hypothetical protein